jgi:hypothetical protein
MAKYCRDVYDVRSGNSCSHPSIFKSLCTSCGKTIVSSDASIAVSYSADVSAKREWKTLTVKGGYNIQFSSEEQKTLSDGREDKLQKAKKLCLVLVYFFYLFSFFFTVFK